MSSIRSFDLIAAASSMSRQVSSADFARSGYSGAASFMVSFGVPPECVILFRSFGVFMKAQVLADAINLYT